MKQYTSYKDSGIDWIGSIPAHWKCVAIKRVLKYLTTGKTPPAADESYFNKNGIPWITPGDFKEAFILNDGSKHLSLKGEKILEIYPAEAVLLIGIGATMGKVVYATMESASNQQINALIFKNDFNPIYGAYYLTAMRDNIFNTAKYTTLPILNQVENKRIPITVPPLDEQEAIVRYLTERSEKIDCYIAEQERLLAALDELRQAEIARVVTRGLNPDAPLRDSGIDWIGKIPSHWKRLYLFQVAEEHYISNKDVHHQNLLSLSYGKIIPKDINKTEGLLPTSFDGYQIVEPGNIVLRLTDLQNDQRSLRVGLSQEEGIVTSAYLALKASERISDKYLYFQLHSNDIHKVFYGMGGGLRQGLNWNGLRHLPVILPPLEEQRAIVEYLDAKTAKIDTMKADIVKQIGLLKEYKQRMISDAVTGKSDVRNQSY